MPGRATFALSRCGGGAGALPIEELAEDAGPAPRVIDVGEDAEEVVGVLAPGAVAGDPSLAGGEDLVLVVAERRTAHGLVVSDETVEDVSENTPEDEDET